MWVWPVPCSGDAARCQTHTGSPHAETPSQRELLARTQLGMYAASLLPRARQLPWSGETSPCHTLHGSLLCGYFQSDRLQQRRAVSAILPLIFEASAHSWENMLCLVTQTPKRKLLLMVKLWQTGGVFALCHNLG